MGRIMDLIRKHILYRNIPAVDTAPKVATIKNQMHQHVEKNTAANAKINKRLEKTHTFFMAKSMGLIK